MWVREAEAKLEAGKDGVDFGNITHDLEDHKVSQPSNQAVEIKTYIKEYHD